MTKEPVAPGLRDELISKELQTALFAVDETRRIEEPLTATEGLDRLGKHLLRVARRLDGPTNEESLRVATKLINEAIAALGPGFLDDRIVLPARVLKGIQPAGGLATVLPKHPTVPLTASELLVNGVGEPGLGKVLLEELRCCDEVDLICAFVGYTGFEPLRDEFRRLIERGGKIRVITSTYLGSTSPKALDEFVKLGAEVRVNYQGHATKLHAKAWLFRRQGELDTAFVGSSNLSEAALFSGLEWNVRLARADAPGVFTRMEQTFESYWRAEAYERYTLEDRSRLEVALAAAKGSAANAFSRQAQRIIDSLQSELADAYGQASLHALPHQQKVLDRLKLRRDEFDEHRHLVVAATGTGKTVMAALDYARLCEDGKPRPRLLFVAHREQILEQARRTFRTALQDPAFGQILAGGAPEVAHDAHVFAMVQTLHNRLGDVLPHAYDVIYIDEAHHGVATTWTDVIRHFVPKELVGLTATPERSDGTSITDLFGGGYTTELRLWEAIDDLLLSPFEYVGVDDGTDLTRLGWHQGDYAVGELSDLYTGDHERVKLIVQAIGRWVEHPQTMRALGFCVTVDHAKFMASQFSERGIKADYLSGTHDQAHRAATLSKLRVGELQVVFSVEVLGEGIDVPDVDTLLLLRPTQSATLFTQQLGRGLRATADKSRCLVLDFIGQHRTEYRHEERLRVLLDPAHGSTIEQAQGEFPYLPAGCAITLERVARERILASLKSVAAKGGPVAFTRDLVRLQSESLPEFLVTTGRTLEEFYRCDNNTMSWTRLQRLAGNSGTPPEHTDPRLQKEEADLLRRVGFLQHMADGLRTGAWTQWLSEQSAPDSLALSTVEQRLATQVLHRLGQHPADLQSGFELLWRHPAVRLEVSTLLTMNHAEVDVMPKALLGLPDFPIVAHARYARDEVFAALGVSSVDKGFTHQSGTYFDPLTRTQLIFVTLHKDEKIFSSAVQYKDYAIASDLFHWETPNNWRQTGPAMLRCIGEGDEASTNRLLFVRERSRGAIEGTFRCFGQVDLFGELEGNRPVGLTWKLRQPLPEVVFESARAIATA